MIYNQLKNMPVHRSMREISELISRDLQDLPGHAGSLHHDPVGVHRRDHGRVLHERAGRAPSGERIMRVVIILIFSLVGIAGSWRRGLVRHPREHLRELARRLRQPWRCKPFPTYAIPLKAGMSIGMLLIATELVMMLAILLFIPREYLAGPCFIGFAIGESLGAAALRIAGGIFTKIADIGSGPDEDRLQDQGRRRAQPRRHRRLHGRQRRRLGRSPADGFETYGVTGVALITFILLAVSNPAVQGS